MFLLHWLFTSLVLGAYELLCSYGGVKELRMTQRCINRTEPCNKWGSRPPRNRSKTNALPLPPINAIAPQSHKVKKEAKNKTTPKYRKRAYLGVGVVLLFLKVVILKSNYLPKARTNLESWKVIQKAQTITKSCSFHFLIVVHDWAFHV